ncbi:MAG: WYL domain-containing protein [Proteobacteria bacterium]|nr:WYL domain-containing protein [Pseudomonadota bacterium]
MTTAELQELMEDDCTLRTVYRDLEQLALAGFPVFNEDSRWRLLENGEGAWSVPIDPTQLLALALSVDLLDPLRGTQLAQPLEDLQRRLLAMLTPAGRAYVAELGKAAVGTLFAPGEYAAHGATLDAIQEAIAKQQQLRICYAPPKRTSADRVVEPYCTWYAAGRVYLIAFCRKREDMRTFAVQRIQEAEVLDIPFDADKSFDAASFARQGFGVYHGPIYHFVIDFTSEVSYLIRERRYHHSQRVMEREGGLRLVMDAAGLPEVAFWVAGFGGNAKPVAPAELVDAVRKIHIGGLKELGE